MGEGRAAQGSGRGRDALGVLHARGYIQYACICIYIYIDRSHLQTTFLAGSVSFQKSFLENLRPARPFLGVMRGARLGLKCGSTVLAAAQPASLSICTTAVAIAGLAAMPGESMLAALTKPGTP